MIGDDVIKEQDDVDWLASRDNYIKKFTAYVEKWFQVESHVKDKPVVKIKVDDTVSG